MSSRGGLATSFKESSTPLEFKIIIILAVKFLIVMHLVPPIYFLTSL